MKKIFFLFTVCFFHTVIFGAVKLNDKDNYIDSVIYTYPDKSNKDVPVQAEIKKVKIRELDQKDRLTIDKNLDAFIKDSSNNWRDDVFTLNDDVFNFRYFTMGKPVYVKGREKAIERMPALDQAQTDTCATFSSTAAMDILMGDGNDIYSNYMSLRLGHALALKMLSPGQKLLSLMNAFNDHSFPNPWDGSQGILIFTQFKDFGLVNAKDENSQNGKFGKKEKKQPLDKQSLKNFKGIPELNCTLLFHNELYDIKDAFGSKAEFVRKIKNELNMGNIVSVGVYLASTMEGANTGMIGKTSIVNGKAFFSDAEQKNIADYNTWSLTKGLAEYIKQNKDNDNFVGSHQMIIVGYIDDVRDKSNGVFILRNSWGADCGDKGNNYITYDYLYYLTNEIVSVTVSTDKNLTKNKKFL